MSDTPLVSVVTPSLNQGDTIAATLRSVQEQTYPRLEHIVVDGGSRDGTLQTLRETGGVVRWKSEPDSGMYDAINKGLAAANGEVLAYLNADDSWFPWTVERAVAELKRRPEAGFVYGDLLVREPSGAFRLDLQPPFRLAYIRRHGFLPQPTVFWRREVWAEEGPFDESLQFVGDCEYWSRIGERRPGRKINEVLALQRDHPEAKRFAEPADLAAEVADVRSRYPRPGRLRGAIARVEAGVWRRAYTLELLAQASRRPPGGAPAPWSYFLAGGYSVSTARLAATLLPLVGARFATGAIEPSTS